MLDDSPVRPSVKFEIQNGLGPQIMDDFASSYGTLLSLAVCLASGRGRLAELVLVEGTRPEHAPVARVLMPDEHGSFLARSLHHLQDNIRRAGPAAAASYTLIGSILLLGGGGAVIDRWQGSAPWGLFVGLLLGVVVGLYEVAKAVWKP